MFCRSLNAAPAGEKVGDRQQSQIEGQIESKINCYSRLSRAVAKTMARAMSQVPHPIYQLLQNDSRYKLEAYQFVREALAYAQDVMGLGQGDASDEPDEVAEQEGPPVERHVSGQELCEAIRLYAVDQFGYMAKVVLNSWGIKTTGDIGEIVFNLINIECMRKSSSDRREDFEDVFDFEKAFQQEFKITDAE
jgi:uncharacterized repeat protein (TIGR04138 family)